MLTQVWTIARATFIESTRQPIVFVLILIAALLQVFNTWNTGFSMGYNMTDSAEVTSDNKLLFDIGLSTVFVLGTLIAAFVATGAITREIENKTVLTVISKPISRVALVLGKYVGVSAVVLLASIIMSLFLLIAIRHGVMSTAGDDLDQPVLVFSGLALLIALLLGAWTNFFYGWNFPQTFVLLLFPLTIAAYVAILFVGKGWKLQSPGTDFLPQVVTASACLILAILVLSAVATAASTRLSQTMTIVVCVGVLVASLLSNYLIGRHVFRNTPFGVVASTSVVDVTKDFVKDQVELTVRLQGPISQTIKPGTPIYLSSSPNGFPLLSQRPYDLGEDGAFSGQLDDINALKGERAEGPAIIAISARDQQVVLRNVGPTPMPLYALPEKGDFLFAQPTSINRPLLILWGAVPNLQYFWLLDAVSQNRPVPATYLGLAAGYAAAQVVVFLALAVMLFQRRDVG